MMNIIIQLKRTSILSARLANPTTMQPTFTKSLTREAPIPELAPVTTATFPAQRSMFKR